MNFEIDPNNIDPRALAEMFGTIEKAIENKSGMIQLTQMLSILNFPKEIENKIKMARGPLKITCNGLGFNCSASNFGKKIKENLPGSGGFLGIIIKESFKCNFKIEVKSNSNKTLIIDRIAGLHADLPGPINPDVNKITVRLPKYVQLTI